MIISTKWLNWVVYIKLPEFFEITNQIIVYLKNKTKSLLETESWERFHDKSCAITVLWFSKSIFRPKFKAISSKTMFTFKHSEQQINKLEKDYFYRFAFTSVDCQLVSRIFQKAIYMLNLTSIIIKVLCYLTHTVYNKFDRFSLFVKTIIWYLICVTQKKHKTGPNCIAWNMKRQTIGRNKCKSMRFGKYTNKRLCKRR